MGRPLRSDRFVASFGGTTSGKIAVTAYRPSGGSLVNSTSAYIISQRGSRLFKIHLEDSSEAVYQLRAVAPASLSAGEFCVQVILSDSTVGYVSKFYNRTVHYVTAAGTTGTATYTLGTEATDEAQASGSGVVNIDVI